MCKGPCTLDFFPRGVKRNDPRSASVGRRGCSRPAIAMSKESQVELRPPRVPPAHWFLLWGRYVGDVM